MGIMAYGISGPSKELTNWQNLAVRLRGWPGIFVAICLTACFTFLLMPWSVEGKSLAVLHGLCAQQPSHSFYFGEQRLPFDARMTGIYGGFLLTCLFLLARGRWRKAGVPPASIIVVVAGFVLALGFDGFNSMLKDMRLWYLYEPSNTYRIITGLLTGVAMAVFIWMLTGQAGFRATETSMQPILTSFRELSVLLIGLGLFTLIVLTNWSPLRIPLTVLLMTSAVLTLTGLMLGFVLLVSRTENIAMDTWQLARPATFALLLAFGLMALLAGGRFIMELAFGLPAEIETALSIVTTGG